MRGRGYIIPDAKVGFSDPQIKNMALSEILTWKTCPRNSY
jgi:hypothetical protein